MKTKQAALLFVFLLAFIMPVASALGPISVDVTNVVQEVEKGGTARFKISENQYEVAPLSQYIRGVKIKPNQLKIDPGKSETANVEITFTDAVSFDQEYDIELNVVSLLNPEWFARTSVTAKIVNPKDVIRIVPDVPKTVSPGEDITYSIHFINRLNIGLTDYKISISSELPMFGKEETVSFSQNEDVLKSYIVPIPKETTPGTYNLRVGVYNSGVLKGSQSVAFAVSEKPLVEENKDEAKSFLQSTIKITKKNTGNTPSKQKVELAMSFFRNWFSAASPAPRLENDKMVWEFTLMPNDTFTLEVATNYRSLFYGIIAVIIATLLFLLYVDRSVTVKKKLLSAKSTESGIAELKILLSIRNGTGKALAHARIIDLVPYVIEPVQEFSTLKPSKVQEGQYHRRMLWDIPLIAPHEERVITYKLKAKPHLGEITLPPASLHYMRGNTLISVRSAPVAVRRLPAPKAKP